MLKREEHFDRHIALLFPDYEKGKDVSDNSFIS